ncbi:hypothetical protein T439DRAFT_331710 [Meredithblackwellia eburnea MCA 4105]
MEPGKPQARLGRGALKKIPVRQRKGKTGRIPQPNHSVIPLNELTSINQLFLTPLERSPTCRVCSRVPFDPDAEGVVEESARGKEARHKPLTAKVVPRTAKSHSPRCFPVLTHSQQPLFPNEIHSNAPTQQIGARSIEPRYRPRARHHRRRESLRELDDGEPKSIKRERVSNAAASSTSNERYPNWKHFPALPKKVRSALEKSLGSTPPKSDFVVSR